MRINTNTALAAIDATNTTTNSTSASLVDAAISNLQVTRENLSASESRIRDTGTA